MLTVRPQRSRLREVILLYIITLVSRLKCSNLRLIFMALKTAFRFQPGWHQRTSHIMRKSIRLYSILLGRETKRRVLFRNYIRRLLISTKRSMKDRWSLCLKEQFPSYKDCKMETAVFTNTKRYLSLRKISRMYHH